MEALYEEVARELPRSGDNDDDDDDGWSVHDAVFDIVERLSNHIRASHRLGDRETVIFVGWYGADTVHEMLDSGKLAKAVAPFKISRVNEFHVRCSW